MLRLAAAARGAGGVSLGVINPIMFMLDVAHQRGHVGVTFSATVADSHLGGNVLRRRWREGLLRRGVERAPPIDEAVLVALVCSLSVQCLS